MPAAAGLPSAESGDPKKTVVLPSKPAATTAARASNPADVSPLAAAKTDKPAQPYALLPVKQPALPPKPAHPPTATTQRPSSSPASPAAATPSWPGQNLVSPQVPPEWQDLAHAHVKLPKDCKRKPGTNNTYVRPDGTEITVHSHTSTALGARTLGKIGLLNDWLFSKVAHVGTDTFVEIRDPLGHIRTSHYRSDSQGRLINKQENQVIQTEEDHHRYETDRNNTLADSTWHNSANKVAVPLLYAGAIAGTVLGGIYLAGAAAAGGTVAAAGELVGAGAEGLTMAGEGLATLTETTAAEGGNVLTAVRPLVSQASQAVSKATSGVQQGLRWALKNPWPACAFLTEASTALDCVKQSADSIWNLGHQYASVLTGRAAHAGSPTEK